MPSYRANYYQGPFIRNINGLGAFSFHEFMIASELDIAMTASISPSNTVQLNWQRSSDATSYVLEKKAPGQSEFSTFKTFAAGTNNFEDIDVAVNSSYSYRIKSYSTLSESAYLETTVKTMPLLSTDPITEMTWKVYPNPTQDYIDIEFPNVVSGGFEITSVGGKSIFSTDIKSSKSLRVVLGNTPAGIYLVTFKNKNGLIFSKRVLKN